MTHLYKKRENPFKIKPDKHKMFFFSSVDVFILTHIQTAQISVPRKNEKKHSNNNQIDTLGIQMF